MFGLSLEKLTLIALIAIVIVGPARLPAYAAKLAALVTALRRMADGAKDRMRDELGPEFDHVDWKKLDPRQYDPRQIIRQALIDPAPPSSAESPGVAPPDDEEADATEEAGTAAPLPTGSPRAS
jgi:sec-independent protein translocase protein TatB